MNDSYPDFSKKTRKSNGFGQKSWYNQAFFLFLFFCIMLITGRPELTSRMRKMKGWVLLDDLMERTFSCTIRVQNLSPRTVYGQSYGCMNAVHDYW